MYSTLPHQIKSRSVVIDNKPEKTYATARTNDINEIKRILTYDATPQVFIGNGWVRINGKSFNGITKQKISEIIKEINCNIAINML